jgi:ATP-dependent 26S proteasome regulatory subunit
MSNQQKLVNDVVALVRARNPIILIKTIEEKRVERALFEPLMKLTNARGDDIAYDIRTWDCDFGIADAAGKEEDGGKSMQDVGAVLAVIRDSQKRTVWFLRDAVTPWFADPTIRRRLRNLARALPSAKAAQTRIIIILSPTSDLPPDLVDHVTVVNWKLPDRNEIASILDTAVAGLPEEVRSKAIVAEDRDAAIDAAIGLTAEAAANVYAQSIVTQNRRIVPTFVADEKKRIVNTKGIEVYDADPRGLDAVGGLEPLKEWLATRRLGFSSEAREFGLPLPKGMLLVGVPGGGKSLTAKAVAAAFACPLIRFDSGAAQSKWVGESQSNIRNVFNVVDAMGRCILWVDEIEKMFAGATSGAADGGVSSDALGTFLTWMQERAGQSFVIATSNDVSKLPPELLRKGRWDDLFFVDLPTSKERAAILGVVFKKYKRDLALIDVPKVVTATRSFTGAEIEALMSDALFKAFADGKRLLCTEDFMEAAERTVPLAKTAPEKITALRDWAKGKARRASLEEETSTSEARNFDD